jgi:hypothetical protein
MKNKLVVAAATILVALSMVSCKKDYNCDCKDTNTGERFETTNYPNTGLVDAQKACKDRQSFWQNTTKPATQCTIL